MKIRYLIVFIFLLFPSKRIEAQTIELGGLYSSSQNVVLGNIPGICAGISYHLKGQYVFSEFQFSHINHFYTQSTNSFTLGLTEDEYIISRSDGEISIYSYKFGLAQKIFKSEAYSFSFGVFAGLNNFHQNYEIKTMSFSPSHLGEFFYEQEDQTLKNKFTYGCFLDMEIKNILIDNLSIYTRIELSSSKFEAPFRGLDFKPSEINIIAISLGIKYHLFE